MDLSILNYVFNLSIIIGFVILLLNVVIVWLGGAFAVGADADVDVDVDVDVAEGSADSGSGFVSFNLKCLCLFLVVFGAMGHMMRPLMTNLLFTVILLSICFCVAGFVYWALYKFLVKRLKENDASALSYQKLPGKRAEVTLSLSGDSMGTISLKDSTGVVISFRAKIDPFLKDKMPPVIQKGEKVIITEVNAEHKLCYVSIDIAQLPLKMGG